MATKRFKVELVLDLDQDSPCNQTPANWLWPTLLNLSQYDRVVSSKVEPVPPPPAEEELAHALITMNSAALEDVRRRLLLNRGLA